MGIWKDIDNFPGYQISSLGRVKSLNYHNTNKENILKPDTSGRYARITLSKNGRIERFMIHRLVAEAFLENPENLPVVNHKDENSFNNCVDNLEWCTVQYNNSYGSKVERMRQKLNIPVVQLTLDGELIKQFASITEAANETDYCKSDICRNCKDKSKTCHGFKFKYLSDWRVG